MSDPKRTALIYDFDGTLARGNIQENSLFITAFQCDRDARGYRRAAGDHGAPLALQLLMIRITRRAGQRSSRKTGPSRSITPSRSSVARVR